MENLSTVLKRRRKELGLTLAQIADVMGVAEAIRPAVGKRQYQIHSL